MAMRRRCGGGGEKHNYIDNQQMNAVQYAQHAVGSRYRCALAAKHRQKEEKTRGRLLTPNKIEYR